MTDITFSKNSHSVSLYCNSVSEEYSNRLITLSLTQSSTNQASGKKDTKIIDLLRITNQFIIKAMITTTSTLSAKEVKDELKLIANGAETDGGTISMTYDGDTLEGYIEKLTFTKNPNDSYDVKNKNMDEIKYECAITFVVGVGL